MPSCRRSAFVTVVLCAMSATPASAQRIPPSPLPGAVPPLYPDAARSAGIEGDVRYRVLVGTDGVPKSIGIVDAPATGHGFEDAVKRAVSAWRFAPATDNGVPVEGLYESVATFVAVLPGEFVFPVSPAEVWTELQRFTAELRLKSQTTNKNRNVLVTKWTGYRKERYPPATDLGLPAGATVQEIQWHASVAPSFAKARVAIGVVTHVRRSDGLLFTVYNDEALVHWFAAKLSERLGQPSEPLSADPVRRDRQSPFQGPGSLEATACKAPSGPPLSMADSGNALANPKLVFQEIPVYPLRQIQSRETGEVLLEGVVTEHGTLAQLTLGSRDVPEEMKTAAVSAASLWRFVPAHVDGCPVQTKVTIEMTFSLR